MSKERILLDEWNPNIYFIVVTLICMMIVTVTIEDWKILLVCLIGFLSMGWAFSFAKPKKNKEKE